MTALTSAELKMMFFGIIVLALVGTIGALYQSDPIPAYTQGTNMLGDYSPGDVSEGQETAGSGWISGMFDVFPPPLNDPACAIVVSIILAPVSVMLGYIAIRAIKDLITQWL